MLKILFVLDSIYTGDTTHPMKKTYFQKYLFKIIRNNSKIPYEILTFFLGKLDKKLFVWQSSYTWDTRYRVWFDLEDSLNQ